MTGMCSTPVETGLVPALTTSMNCAADGLMANGYAALAAPGGPIASALTGALTLLVGFYAIRLMLGHARLDAGQASVTAIKIGLVFVLAGNWAVYQQVVARTLFDAPQAVAGLIVGGLDNHGAFLSASPMEALQSIFDELIRDTRSLSAHAGDRSPLLGGPAFATMTLNGSAYLIVVMGAGVPAAVRLCLALFLALGPIAALFMLFRGTQGLFEGWLRALVALSAVSLTSAVLLPIELSVLDPSVTNLVRERAADAIRPESALTVVLVILVFALTQLVATVAALMLARGLSLPRYGEAAIAGNGYEQVSQTRAPSTGTALARSERIAQAGQYRDRGRNVVRQDVGGSMTDAIASADRARNLHTSAASAPGLAGYTPHPIRARAIRPRRELLVSRRNR